MLLLLALLITFNLCAGYVLGVYVGVLPWTASNLPALGPGADLDFLDTAPAPAAAAPVHTATPPVEQTATPNAAPATPPPAPLFTADQLASAAALPEQGQEQVSPEVEEPTPPEADTAEVMEGVATFQERLANASSAEEPAEEPEDSMIEAAAEEPQAEQESSADAESNLAEQQAEPSDVTPPENTGGIKQIDELIGIIDALVAAEDGEHLVVAAVRPDPIQLAEGVEIEELDTRLLTSLTTLVQELTEATHGTACNTNGQLLIALPGDTPEEASRRLDTLRQQVEKTTFDAGETKLQATVTCAIAEAGDEPSRQALLDNLEEALGESERHGSNRSYHHDGRFPAPALPEEAQIAPRTIAL